MYTLIKTLDTITLEPEESMMAYCDGICTDMSRRVPQFGLSLRNDGFNWRCYVESSLDKYYFSSSSLYCTRNSELSSLFNKCKSHSELLACILHIHSFSL